MPEANKDRHSTSESSTPSKTIPSLFGSPRSAFPKLSPQADEHMWPDTNFKIDAEQIINREELSFAGEEE